MASYNTRFEKPPSKAVIEARARRLARAAQIEFNTEWFITEVCDKIRTTMKNRVRIATEYVKSKVIRNISRPVTKTYVTRKVTVTDVNGKTRTKKQSEVHISNRSVKGEFPKADTTMLMKTVFSDYREPSPGDCIGYIGTPLDYGVILELKMQRSFMVRTLFEEYPKVMRILSGPIK